MSPRGNPSAAPSSSSSTNPSSRTAPAPYSRRPAGQPKSSRQQFSACGACRMRRVRCDLKDLPFTTTGPHPSCSNCKERGLKCVDEFADVKAVKLLRRGRRLQQVEALYGKVVGPDGISSIPPATRLPSIIPQLKVEFFSSPFWHWFCIQRPILDPAEFSARFFAHTKGVQSLGNEGGLLAMILVVWAASFGIDERGLPESPDSNDDIINHLTGSETTPSSTSGRNNRKSTAYISPDKKNKDPMLDRRRKAKKDKTEAMLREVLELVDFHGVMRRPTWDGVRVLLLILPLMEDAHPLERLAMYEATLSQTQALCTLASSSSEPSSSSSLHTFVPPSDDAVVRARIFWYAYMHEGISTGMRGGRLVLHNDDFDAFQSTLPPMAFGPNGLSTPSPHSSQNTLPPPHRSQRSSPGHSFFEATQLLSMPLQLSAICRKVHSALTGPKATRTLEDHGVVEANGMREIWEDLDHCWQEFDAMRRRSSNEQEYIDTEQFVSAWQIFIFECHNIIRESLKHCISNLPSGDSSSHHVLSASSPRPSSHSSNSSPYLSPHHLYAVASRKCFSLLPSVLRIIKFHLSREGRDAGGSGLFEWDAGLVRDGCFFAGFLAAGIEGDIIDFGADERDEDSHISRGRLSAEDGVSLCLTALAEMRWAFSKSEEREETVRMVWENRKVGRHNRYPQQDLGRLGPATYPDHIVPSQYTKSSSSTPHLDSQLFASVSSLSDRPSLPPLSTLGAPRRADSAPNTSFTTDGHGPEGWPTYTPPGTATSVTTSAGTGISARGSPIFANMGSIPFKGESHDSVYPTSGDLNQFSFSAPISGPGINTTATAGSTGYHHRGPAIGSTHNSIYMDPGTYSTTGSSIIHPGGDINGCPQFGDDCNGYYH